MVTLNPKFTLKSTKSEKERPIHLRLYFDYNDFTYPINRKVHPNYWDSENGSGRVIVGPGKSEFNNKLKEINVRINEIESAVIRLSNHYNLNKISLTPDILKKDLDKELKKETKSRDKLENLVNEHL